MKTLIKLIVSTVFFIAIGFKTDAYAPPLKPDLVVRSVTTNWIEGFLVVTVRIKNIGTAKAGIFNNYVELGPSNNPERVQERLIAGLHVNQIKEIEFIYPAAIVPTINPKVKAITDSKLDVSELNEGNNSKMAIVVPHP